MTSAIPSADSPTSGSASQTLVHLAILAVVGIGMAIYLAPRGKS